MRKTRNPRERATAGGHSDDLGDGWRAPGQRLKGISISSDSRLGGTGSSHAATLR